MLPLPASRIDQRRVADDRWVKLLRLHALKPFLRLLKIAGHTGCIHQRLERDTGGLKTGVAHSAVALLRCLQVTALRFNVQQGVEGDGVRINACRTHLLEPLLGLFAASTLSRCMDQAVEGGSDGVAIRLCEPSKPPRCTPVVAFLGSVVDPQDQSTQPQGLLLWLFVLHLHLLSLCFHASCKSACSNAPSGGELLLVQWAKSSPGERQP
mmetsp:Transcript_58549/g.171301  ORF Transcript_58549/g.171301 Transcript_58549/m.171301 type:complete len:210 (-) Transcript_58549:202-831(-)